MARIWALFILTGTLISCNPNPMLTRKLASTKNSSQGELPPPQTSPQPSLPQAVCYSKKQAPSCFELTTLPENLLENDYDYLEPLSQNGFPSSFDSIQYSAPQWFIDLSLYNENEKLSDNFQLKEFMSFTKGRYAILSPHLIQQLQGMRIELKKPLFINSGYRSPAYNAQLSGAAKWSRHMYGDAADFYANNISFEELRDLCLNYGASFYQIYTAHIHCDWRNTPLPDEFYSIGTSQNKAFWKAQSLSPLYKIITNNIGNGFVEFSIDENYKEDSEGDLIYEWHVQTPDNKTLKLRSPRITLLNIPGNYQISVTIGGSIRRDVVIHLD